MSYKICKIGDHVLRSSEAASVMYRGCSWEGVIREPASIAHGKVFFANTGCMRRLHNMKVMLM